MRSFVPSTLRAAYEVLGDLLTVRVRTQWWTLGMTWRLLRKDWLTTCGCRVEVIMKDNHTICDDPRRAVRWVRIAREEAEAV